MYGIQRTGIPCEDKSDRLPEAFRRQLKRPTYWFFGIAAIVAVVIFVWVIASAR